MCGEHISTVGCHDVKAGSSPHVRGARGLLLPRGIVLGIIPACAGSTSYLAAIFHLPRDHPRMCGEHRNIIACICVSLGSSPHVRGAQKHCRHRRGVPGIIPACAGSTMPAMKIMSFRARTSSFPRSPTITAFVPCGTHVSHIFDAIAAESTICTYSGNHSESSIRFVLPHNAFAPSDKATRSSRTEEFMPDSAPISATFPISEATSPLHHMFFAVCRRVIATPINHNNAPETDYKSP